MPVFLATYLCIKKSALSERLLGSISRIAIFYKKYNP